MHRMEGGRGPRRGDDEALAVGGDFNRALGPMGTDHPKPLVDFPAKEAVFWMDSTAQLVSDPARREERNRNFSEFKYPTLPSNPDIEIKNAG